MEEFHEVDSKGLILLWASKSEVFKRFDKSHEPVCIIDHGHNPPQMVANQTHSTTMINVGVLRPRNQLFNLSSKPYLLVSHEMSRTL